MSATPGPTSTTPGPTSTAPASPARATSGPTSTALDRAAFIGAPDDTGRSPVLTTGFRLDRERAEIRSADLLATAHGVYQARLGGRDVTDSVLNPGWSAYAWRLPYQSFDVTDLLRDPEVAPELSVLLSGGWWRGKLGYHGANVDYGTDLGLLAALTITYTDGHVQEVTTGPDWTSSLSCVELASLYDGQREDRRLTPTTPQPVRVLDAAVISALDRTILVPQAGPPITRHEVLRPERIWTAPSGATLVDFGQNLVGWLRCTVTGPAGTVITIRHTEVLAHDELATAPLRSAEATDRLILAGDPDGEFFEPTQTFHGFRFAEVTGWSGALTADDLEAVVVHSEIPRTGDFECSDERVNRLIHNTVWSQKGNFLSVPTDCPQRDERLGWTGDLAVFAQAATFPFDVADFLDDWLADLAVETRHNHLRVVPYVVPDILVRSRNPAQTFGGAEGQHGPTAIWGDAAVWVPQALWTAYGDVARLADHYPAMVAHLASIEPLVFPSGLWDTGFQFGDWVDPDAPPDRPGEGKADPGVVATACLFRSASFTAEAARVLDKTEDAARWQRFADRTRAAFRDHYVSEDARIRSDCATVYALAIHFGLLDGEPQDQAPQDGYLRRRAGDRLAEIVREAGYRVSTGFAGTPYVPWALSETGHVEDAYRLLLETSPPSFLYPVTQGATTIWERWDALRPDGSIHPGDMTSFNHYALGAVADWIYQVVLGLRPAEPGYARVRIQPRPGPGIDWARGALETRHGRVAVEWFGEDDAFQLNVRVPDGVTAEVELPDGAVHEAVGGEHGFAT